MRKFVLLVVVTSLLVYISSIYLKRDPQLPIPRLVMLYATCTLNKGFLSPYVKTVRYTPNLESFAKQSVIFKHHHTEVGFSGPAFASLFSGSYVYHHGIYYHPSHLNDKTYLISEAFRENGYDTYFWNGHENASAKFNYAQGIEQSHIIPGGPNAAKKELTGRDEIFNGILRRLKNDPSYRAFILVNFTATHAPYSQNSGVQQTQNFCRSFPEECRGFTSTDLAKYLSLDDANHAELSWRYQETIKTLGLGPQETTMLARVLEAVYKSSVFLLDRSFGETIHAIRRYGLFEKSLIAFTSDHGEILYRKDAQFKWTHWGLEPEVLSIPLIVHLQGKGEKELEYNNITRSIDVFPTLAGLAGIHMRLEKQIDGVDLSSSIRGEKASPDLVAYACTGLQHPSVRVDDPALMQVQAMTLHRTYRLIPEKTDKYAITVTRAPMPLFPGIKLLLTEESESSVKNSLRLYRNRLIAGYKRPTYEKDWEETRERLKALGYVQ